MLTSIVAGIVAFCARRPWLVMIVAALLGVASGLYALGNFTINTDTEALLPSNLAWQRHQLAYAAVFPPHQIIAVVEAPTPELTEIAADHLVAALRRRSDLFLAVLRPQGGEFFDRSALLYPPEKQVAGLTHELVEARDGIGLLATDPTLRGVMQALSAGVGVVQEKRLPASALVRPMNLLSGTLDQVLAGHFASLSWRALFEPETPASRRQFIEIDPRLDFKSMQPGHAATQAIRAAVAQLRLGPELGATVQLTGRVPINDEQFAALGESAIPGFVGTVLAVLAILWLALRSLRIIVSAVITLAIGFAVTAALGILLVGAFNLLSIAFAVLFVGLGADFALQFSVRYRAERHLYGAILPALRSSAEKAGGPLALAAAGTAVGFFSFLPTQYRGVAELGEIAGFGMLVAFAATITVLPALLALVNPPAEPRPMGFAVLAPADRFLARHRIAIVVLTIVAVLAATPALLRIRFDFDPIHLQNPHSEAVQTYRRLNQIPDLGINAVNLIAPTVADIPKVSKPLSTLPEVAGIRSVEDLIPQDQKTKLAMVRAAASQLDPAVKATPVASAPNDAQTVTAIRATAAALENLAAHSGSDRKTATAAFQLARRLSQLADAAPAVRQRAEQAVVIPLKRDLQQLRNMLNPRPVTIASLPPDISRDWITADGRARVEVLPRGNPNDTDTLQRFADAVLKAAPDAAGTPVALVQSKRTVLLAFVEAGALALAAIAMILWLTLRRFGDVLLTLAPLVVAGAVTLELMGLIGAPLNFANVIALPLLLGVGVAFKIYYIMAWRRGRTNLLQSTLTRAVVFSALTTATAFGSLWLSKEPGMSSMGGLMALALMCTLAAAVLFQPALMGPPRARQPRAEPAPPPHEPNATPPREPGAPPVHDRPRALAAVLIRDG